MLRTPKSGRLTHITNTIERMMPSGLHLAVPAHAFTQQYHCTGLGETFYRRRKNADHSYFSTGGHVNVLHDCMNMRPSNEYKTS